MSLPGNAGDNSTRHEPGEIGDCRGEMKGKKRPGGRRGKRGGGGRNRSRRKEAQLARKGVELREKKSFGFDGGL